MENPDGSFIAYTPSLSLRDGSLYALNGIYDLTPYELLGIEKEEWEEADGSMYVYDWVAIDYDNFSYSLDLQESGDCFLGVTDDEDSVVVVYQGWWEFAGGEINLCLWEDPESEPAISGTYIPELLEEHVMHLTWSSGDYLTSRMAYEGAEDFF